MSFPSLMLSRYSIFSTESSSVSLFYIQAINALTIDLSVLSNFFVFLWIIKFSRTILEWMDFLGVSELFLTIHINFRIGNPVKPLLSIFIVIVLTI